MKSMTNQAFEEYYSNIFKDRWKSLRESLLAPASPVPYGDGLAKPYLLDRASVLAAASLRLPREGEILDACAAPGGKSLVIASRMAGGARLLCNELSPERRRRLVNTLGRHLDGETRKRAAVCGFDAGALAARRSERERFGAVLLDAPCSSERHVMQNPRALAEWTPARPRFLARRQWALLSAAFLLLKPGGSLVYSTCALSPEENDGNAGRLLEKYGSLAALDPPDFPEGEETRLGRLILPDTSDGMGPMYVARFRKMP